MSVISITITESEIQVLAGVPESILLEVNIPSTIFYTLDGTTPTTDSSIYIDSLLLPTNQSSLIVSLYATNGSDSSAIITKTYSADISQLRLVHDKVRGLSPFLESRANSYPFGSVSTPVPVQYGNTGGITVDSPDLPTIPDGYDGTATGTSPGGTDLPLTDYQLIFSETDNLGQRGHGIGNLPATVSIRVPAALSPSASSETSSPFFNPKALVIYQDSREPPFDAGVSYINKQFFASENSETYRDGIGLNTTAFEGSQWSGSFIRQYYNPADNTINYYYRDAATLRWIISKEPYQPKGTGTTNLSNIMWSSRDQGAGAVYKWYPFVGRRLI